MIRSTQIVPAGEVKDDGLPALVRRAAQQLASATTAAEVLDAKDAAATVYDAAKRAARVARAKGAHDELVAKAHRAQADALEIEAQAKRRLADEYDAAQDAGDVASRGRPRKKVSDANFFTGNEAEIQKRKAEERLRGALGEPATLAEMPGLSKTDIHDARQIRDVIAANPTAVRAALDHILSEGDEPTRAALKRAIAPATVAIRADQTAAKKVRRSERETILAEKIEALPDEKFGVIVADPEWRFEPYSRETGMDRAADNHYPTNDVNVIKSRPVASIAAPDCVLFLWATAPMMPQALEVMAAWGFTYVTQAVWVKQRAGEGRGSGYWFTGEHELLLVGTRGKVVAPAPGTQFPSVILAPAGEHSAKPEKALEIVDAYFPSLPKIELNRRGPARPGWSAWGAEAEFQSDDDAFSEVKGAARPENAAGVEPSSSVAVAEPQAPQAATAVLSNPQEPTSSQAADRPAPNPSSVSATPSKADVIRRIRPHCQHPGSDLCGGSGRNHCSNCRQLMADGEAA